MILAVAACHSVGHDRWVAGFDELIGRIAHRFGRVEPRRRVRRGGRSTHLTFLARWPSRKAIQRARDRIREITGRKRLLVPVEDIVGELNRFLRGWAGYFRYGNSARVLGQIRNYALRRVALLLSKTGKRRRSWDWGMRQVLRSPNHLGLISLDGAVISPRPFRDWRVERRR